jgi:peptidoglycan/xylan/chitin deacetylase (PgdA/CDA1 family)
MIHRSSHPLVLCYHGISEEWPNQLAVAPSLLRRQISSLLVRGFCPATAAEIVSGEGKLLHITFDDAYKSVLAGLDVLESMSIPVTMFACPDYVDNGRPLDVPEVRSFAIAFPQEMATMTWDELRKCSDRGVEIGSHTLTHAHLATLNDPELERELVESRLRLEEELQRPCRFLAYPYGEHNDRVRSAARRAGYDAAFSLWQMEQNGFDPFAIRRVDLYRKDNVLRTTLKTTLAYSAVKYLLNAIAD